ncbi:hypothetical protein ACFL1E_05770 [Candidatus Omnitrophota bacterium]
MGAVKKSIAVLVLSVVLCSGVFLAEAASPGCETMKNCDLTGMLIDVLGLEIPADTDRLSYAEFCEVRANVLVENGMTLMSGKDLDETVTYGTLAEILYDVLGGPAGATSEEKIEYLASQGYMGSGNAADAVCSSEILTALNIPEFTTAIAETYTPPTIAMNPPEANLEPPEGPPPFEGPTSNIEREGPTSDIE